MNPRTTLVLAVVAALLGAFIWLHEIGGEAARQSAEDDAKRLHPGLESSDIQALAFTTRDGVEARFERREGRWWLVAPVEAPADATALDGIAGALVNLPREGRVEEPGALEQYDLGDEARVVRFEVAGETKGLRIGRTTPVGGHRYVARLDEDEVAYVATYRLNSLDRDLVDLRDRRIFGFEAADVVGLELTWPEGAVELERDEAGDWQMTAPVAAPADATRIRELLSDLSFLRAQSFIDEPDEQVQAASQDPVLELRWTVLGRDPGADGDPAQAGEAREAAEQTQEIRIGGRVGEGLLLSRSDGRLYTIAPERLEDFDRSVNAYRDKTLASFALDRAGRIELELDDESGESRSSITVVLGEGGWTRLEPTEGGSAESPLDSEAISELVRTLADLHAADILAEEMGESELASLGLAPPRASLKVADRKDPGAEPRILAGVELGRYDAERGIFARRTGSPTIYVLDPELAELLPLSSQAFEERYSTAGRGLDEGEGEGGADELGAAARNAGDDGEARPEPREPESDEAFLEELP